MSFPILLPLFLPLSILLFPFERAGFSSMNTLRQLIDLPQVMVLENEGGEK